MNTCRQNFGNEGPKNALKIPDAPSRASGWGRLGTKLGPGSCFFCAIDILITAPPNLATLLLNREREGGGGGEGKISLVTIARFSFRLPEFVAVQLNCSSHVISRSVM